MIGEPTGSNTEPLDGQAQVRDPVVTGNAGHQPSWFFSAFLAPFLDRDPRAMTREEHKTGKYTSRFS